MFHGGGGRSQRSRRHAALTAAECARGRRGGGGNVCIVRAHSQCDVRARGGVCAAPLTVSHPIFNRQLAAMNEGTPLQELEPSLSDPTTTTTTSNVVVAAWRGYQSLLSSHPLRTKAVTAGVISALGEVIGQELRRHKGAALTPSVRLRRLLAFVVYGCVLNGPVFDWWYRTLERMARSKRLQPLRPHTATFKILVDRGCFTPPYLALTLVALRWLQDFRLGEALTGCRAVYAQALITNWKVWTVAQIINFNVVPLEFRVLFGNFVACIWNVYLSSVSA